MFYLLMMKTWNSSKKLSCRKAFRSSRIHIGMDEAHFVGRGRYLDCTAMLINLFAAAPSGPGYIKSAKIRLSPHAVGDMFFRVE